MRYLWKLRENHGARNLPYFVHLVKLRSVKLLKMINFRLIPGRLKLVLVKLKVPEIRCVSAKT